MASNSKKHRLSSLAAAVVALTVAPMAHAQTSPPSGPKSGVTPIPLDPPPTGPQRALPNPAAPIASSKKPLGKSPSLGEIDPAFAKRPITLQEAISIALATNPDLAQAGENLLFAEGRVGEVGSALGPTLGFTPGEQYIKNIYAPAYALQATLPIDIDRVLSSATEQAKFEEVASRLNINGIRNQIVFNVESQFYAVLRAQALVKVAVQDLQESLDELNDANVRYSAQAVTYLDVVRAQTLVANSQKGVIQARNGVSTAFSNLAIAMGIDVSSPLTITDAGAVDQPPGVVPPPAVSATGSDQLTPAPPPSSVSLDQNAHLAQSIDHEIETALTLGPEYRQALKEALETRPEILQADANIAAAKKGLYVAKRSILPSLSVGVGFYDLRSNTGTQINEPQGFIGLTIPFYDSGLARGREQEARAGVSSAITTRRQQVDSVSLDVQQSYLNLIQARDQVAVANQALAQAQEGLKLARVRYNTGVSSRAGISPLLEVSDAQAALTLAEQNQVNALYDYNAARSQLDRSIGRFAYVSNGPGYAAVPNAGTVGRPVPKS